MKFPITVNEIKFAEASHPIRPGIFNQNDIGRWASVRPVGDKKTYLGIYLGDLHSVSISYDKEKQALSIGQGFLGNPSLWVPDLKRIVQGYECWWGIIESPDDLKKITDADINNQWYVQALRMLTDGEQK